MQLQQPEAREGLPGSGGSPNGGLEMEQSSLVESVELLARPRDRAPLRQRRSPRRSFAKDGAPTPPNPRPERASGFNAFGFAFAAIA